MSENNLRERLAQIGRALSESNVFAPPMDGAGLLANSLQLTSSFHKTLQTARSAREKLSASAAFLTEKVIVPLRSVESAARRPEDFSHLQQFSERLLEATRGLQSEMSFVPVYGDLLSLYISSMHKAAGPGLESRILELILNNIARRKAVELSRAAFNQSVAGLEDKITIAVISKRYAVYVLAVRGIRVLLRAEIPFRQFGTSPEGLALQIVNLLLKADVRLSDVTDVVCGGGDLGALPDGIYVLTEKIRNESWKHLHNSSLNRGALVAWELREILRKQAEKGPVHASMCSPLSFSTLAAHDLSFFYSADSAQVKQSLKGYVKVTPLKSIAALISELEGVNQESLNLLVMSLDELFASAVRKIGSRIIREMAAQEANRILIDFDFAKIVQAIEQENFVIPPHFRLASREIGTGVKEICELLMIIESGKISQPLSRSLNNVVDAYCRKVDMVLEMASSGSSEERPQFVAITSMMAGEPHFRELFSRIRGMVDNPFAPLLCLDSLEHEYLIANHLFEMYINPAKGDRRLNFSEEERSMRQAVQVLGSARGGVEAFSFASLLADVSSAIASGSAPPANLVVVGADNEDALAAVAAAKEQGVVGRIALIGDPEDVSSAIERCKISLSPGMDPSIEIIPIDPLASDYEAKKKSMAEIFHTFLVENRDFIVMKGSVDTGPLLREALAIYKSDEPEGHEPAIKRLASHTALFVLPDGRFFALSDAGVNPGFRSADALLKVIENQLDVVRKLVDPDHMLKVAIITAVEKETSAIPATLLAAETQSKAKALEGLYGPLAVEGPLSFDLATVPEVAEEKRYHGAIKGDANCLVATDINTANVLYKMLSKTMGSLGLLVDNGGIITAGPGTVPIVLTSRGDTAQTKLNSILLALAYGQSRGSGRDVGAGDPERRRESKTGTNDI